MISSRCLGGAKEKIFWNATVFKGMDSTMMPSKSRMRVVRGFVGVVLSVFMMSSPQLDIVKYCFTDIRISIVIAYGAVVHLRSSRHGVLCSAKNCLVGEDIATIIRPTARACIYSCACLLSWG